MKHYIYLLLGIAALTLTSCNEKQSDLSSDNLSFNVILDNEVPVSKSAFEMMSDAGVSCFTLEAEPMTKSVLINNSTSFSSIYDSFEVEGNEGPDGTSPVFHGRAVYNTTSHLWDLTDATYTWKPFRYIEVFAAATNIDNTELFNGITYNGNPSTCSFDFSLPSDLDSQKDPLLGYFKGSVGEGGTVSLKFTHPLTSLVFKVGRMPLNTKLQVNSITLSGIDTRAHCVVSFADNGTHEYTWSTYSGRTNYKQVVTNPAPQDPGAVIFDETAAFIVLPKVFPDDTEAKIIINITEDGRTYDIFTSLAGTEWKAGETNVYALSYHGDKKAILMSGPDFNAALTGSGLAPNKNSVHKIVFEVNSTVTTGTQVQAPGSRPIYMNYDNITNTITVSSDDYEIYTGSSCNSMFSGLTNLTSIEGMEYVSTKNAVDMKYMFYQCQRMTSFPLEHLDTRKVTSMAVMFRDCDAVTSFDLSPLSSESLIDAEGMFRSCNRLNTIVFGEQFTCKYVETWGFMFAQCPITTLDWSHITPEHAADIEYMFSSCENITSIDMSAFAASNSTIYFAAGLFGATRRLTSLNMGLVDFSHLRRPLRDSANNMMQNTSSNVAAGGCTVTCLQAAKDVMTGNYTAITNSKFTWNIITPEP